MLCLTVKCNLNKTRRLEVKYARFGYCNRQVFKKLLGKSTYQGVDVLSLGLVSLLNTILVHKNVYFSK